MAYFEEKNRFCLYLSSFTALNKKDCLQQIPIFLWICSCLNLLRKTNFLIISGLLSVILIFLLKREVFFEIPQKCFKTTGKHSLAVCGSSWGDKQFLLIFVPFYWFDPKKLFKQIQIFLRISPFSNLFRKTNFLSISVLLSELINFFYYKETFSVNFPKNSSKQQRSIV